MGFRLRGNKIILPINRTQIIYNREDGRLDKLVFNRKNSLGFRGEEPPKDFDRWLTILTVGGSTTECFVLNEEKSWPHLLYCKLKEDFSRLWLNNAGLGGHSTYGHFILMRDYIRKLHPKVVLFLVGINDVGLATPSNQDDKMKQFSAQNLERLIASLAQYSEVASLLLNLYRYFFPKMINASSLGDIGEIDFLSLKEFMMRPDEEQSARQLHTSTFVPQYRERLKKVIAITKDNAIEPVLITQPMLYGDTIDDLSGLDLGKIKATHGLNGKTAWQVVENYNDITRQVGKEENLVIIELAKKMPKSTRYFYDLMHYTNEGAAKVADIIYQDLAPYLRQKY